MQKLIWALLFLLVTTSSGAETWRSTDDSALNFVAKVSDDDLPGAFKDFDVELTTDQENSLLGFIVKVNLADADLGDSETNATLFSPVWFNAKIFPQAIFRSFEITQTSDNKREVIGELDLKGLKNTIRFPIEFRSDGDSASLTGTASINRNNFKVGSGEWSSAETVGVLVKLSFDVSLERVH